MFRSAASKVVWVGRATVFLVGLAVILALVFGVTSTALGANGKPFILGEKNVATAVSKLVGSVTGPSLLIGNGSEDARATALQLNVKPGKPPLKVNSSGKVANLNADRLDGKDSGELVQGKGATKHGATTLTPGSEGMVLAHTARSPAIIITYRCPNDLTQNGGLLFEKIGQLETPEKFDVFSDNGGTNPDYHRTPDGWDMVVQPAAPGGEHVTFQAHGEQGDSMATIEVFSVHRAYDCHVQAQGLFTY